MGDVARLVDLDAERAVLGAALLDPDGPADLDRLLTPEDYADLRHGGLHRVLVALYRDGIPPDVVTIQDRAEQMGVEVEASYIARLMASTPTSIYLDHYARIVRDLAQLRRWVAAAQEIAAAAYEKRPPEELQALVQDHLRRLQVAAEDGAYLEWGRALENYWDVLERRAERAKAGPSPFRPPWPSWREFIPELMPGTVTMLTGADGTGKTIYLEAMADWYARQGLHVVFVHFELPPELMGDRLMVRHSGLPLARLRSGQLTDEEQQVLMETQDRLSKWTGRIDYLHTPGWNVQEVTARLAQVLRPYTGPNGKAQAQPPVVVILDYLDKIQMAPHQIRARLSDLDRSADDVERLKIFAEDVKIPLVTATQLRKLGKEKKFEDLGKDDVVGSGQKTNKVQAVVMLWRELQPDGTLSNEVRVKFAKNNMGKLGSVRQVMVPERFAVGDPVLPGVPRS